MVELTIDLTAVFDVHDHHNKPVIHEFADKPEIAHPKSAKSCKTAE